MHQQHSLSISAVIGIVSTACASATPGARPHDMSAAHHQAEAASHERERERHATQHDPSARVSVERCPNVTARAGTAEVCWLSITNPTEEHLREAERHRRMAADHRAASQALRDAETRACAGVSEADRDWSPVSRARDVVSVTPLVDHVTVMRGAVERTSGVIITLRSVPGLSVESLQRIVDCHLARNSAMGHQVPELAECPLVPRGVTARVVRGSTGFDVEVRAADDGTLRDVQARAAALATRVGSAQ